MITVDGLRVRAGGRWILGEDPEVGPGVDLRIRTGAVVGIVGPNGSGKSTLLRALLRAVPIASGSVVIDGADAAHLRRREIAERIAFVGQHADAVDPAVTAADEVALGLARRRLRGRGAEDRAVAEALTAMDVGEHALSPLSALSGGERQRVALARALAQRADHVLLDEPTNHLDIRHRLQALAMLRRIAPTVVVVLHEIDLAARFCDEVVLLDAGRIVAAGAPSDVLVPRLLDPVYGVSTTVRDENGRMLLGFDLRDAAPSASSPSPASPSLTASTASPEERTSS